MIRRSFLGFLGGAGAALSRAQAAKTTAKTGIIEVPWGQAIPTSMFDEAVGAPSSSGSESKYDSASYNRKWKLFREFMAEPRRQQRRKQIARAFLGNYPPGIDSCHSWAPWFKASVAAKRIEADEHNEDSLTEKVKEHFFGKSD